MLGLADFSLSSQHLPFTCQLQNGKKWKNLARRLCTVSGSLPTFGEMPKPSHETRR